MTQVILSGKEISTAIENHVKSKFGLKASVWVKVDVPLLVDCEEGNEEYTQSCEFQINVKDKK